MKISQLVLREEFYNIINNTVKSNSFFLTIPESCGNEYFKSYQYLNIIASDNTSKICRNMLVGEYRLSTSIVKRIIQELYVSVAFIPVITNLFVHKKLLFPKQLSKFTIVGGNHRIRLFDNKMQNIVVLLKTGENKKFVINDIEARTRYSLVYAPKILSHGDDWLIEEFVAGVPLNRIDNVELLNESFVQTVKLHMESLIKESRKEQSIKSYLESVLSSTIDQIELIKENNALKDQLINTLKSLENKILGEKTIVIETAITHGDFQKGNIRVTPEKKIIVLDWESSDCRFYLYDLFVILSGRREGVSFEKGLRLFFDNCNNYDKAISKYSKELITYLIFLEDLRFNIFEDISLRYYKPGIKSGSVASEIDAILAR